MARIYLILLIVLVAVGGYFFVSNNGPQKLYNRVLPDVYAASPVNVSYPAYATPSATFYVSPTGDDANPGTEELPWKSFYKAATTLQAGQMAVFGDGIYNETQYRPYSAIANSGTPDAPIVFKAQNKRQAILNFQNVVNATPIWILGNDNIVIQDFVITKPVKGTNYGDGLLRCWFLDLGNGVVDGAENCWILGNEFRNAYEPVKTSQAPNALFDGNLFTLAHVAFGSVQGDRVIFRNNEIVDAEEDGLQTKGGTINAQVYNNYIHTSAGHTTQAAIYVGGNGWESYNNVAYNNVIVSEVPGAIETGIVLQGCWYCSVLNNTIVGTNIGFHFYQGNLGSFTSKGDTNYKYSKDTVLKNNIVQNCTWGRLFAKSSTIGVITFDYNNFYQCTTDIPAQTHPVNGDPLFIDKMNDWHLYDGSSAYNSGTVTSHNSYSGQGLTIYRTSSGDSKVTFTGESVDTSKDIDGISRTEAWELGVYDMTVPGSVAPPTPTPTPVDTIAPTVEITAPVNGAVVERGSTTTIEATASDDVGVTKVEFRINGSLKCTDTTAPYSCNWNVTGPRNTLYTLEAKAYDARSNSSIHSIQVVSSN